MGDGGGVHRADVFPVPRPASPSTCSCTARRSPRTLSSSAVAVSRRIAFRHPAHERRLADALHAALPAVPVVASHEILPLFREYERTSTTTAEAYLRPKVSTYVARAAAQIAAPLQIMTSSGGTLAPEAATTRAASLALSGPAGGVVGARLVGQAVGIADLLTLDMGGTIADASSMTGSVAMTEGAEVVTGIPLAHPAIHTGPV